MSFETLLKEGRAHMQAIASTMEEQSEVIERIADAIIQCLRGGGKVMLCGNGGSAADAQHWAAELVNRFRLERRPMAALALTTDTSVLTAIGNDSDFGDAFCKQIEALGKPQDILVAISTSGKALNVRAAILQAQQMGIRTIGFTGAMGVDRMKCDLLLVVPSTDTARIQESHQFAYHVICGIVEKAIAADDRREAAQ